MREARRLIANVLPVSFAPAPAPGELGAPHIAGHPHRMTLRARPVARRRGRAGWDSGDRRNNLINLGFFLAIGLSILILIGYSVWSWYDAHYGSAAVVNGQTITKDEWLQRIKIEGFRLSYVESRIQTLMAKGRISRDDGAQQLSFIAQR